MDKHRIIQEMHALPSAWTGHLEFAQWLVDRVRPTTTVDLGVDYGFSLFALALGGQGTVYGVDSFEGDIHAGYHPDAYRMVSNFQQRHAFDHVQLIRSWFTPLAQKWLLPIDILHIDGLHTYSAITEDWQNWSKFVPATGVVIMHDVISFPADVGRFYNELPLPKAYFEHSAGLGIVTWNVRLLEDILRAFPQARVGPV